MGTQELKTLAKDLLTWHVTIHYLLDGDGTEVVGKIRAGLSQSFPLGLGGVRLETQPLPRLVVEEAVAIGERTYTEEVVATIPLEDVVAIEVDEAREPWGDDPILPVARWYRDRRGELVRFVPSS